LRNLVWYRFGLKKELMIHKSPAGV